MHEKLQAQLCIFGGKMWAQKLAKMDGQTFVPLKVKLDAYTHVENRSPESTRKHSLPLAKDKKFPLGKLPSYMDLGKEVSSIRTLTDGYCLYAFIVHTFTFYRQRAKKYNHSWSPHKLISRTFLKVTASNCVFAERRARILIRELLIICHESLNLTLT